MEKPTVTVLRRDGRPLALSTSAGRSAPVHLKLTPEDFDQLYAAAQRQRVSMQEVVRRSLKRVLQSRPRRDTEDDK